MRLRLLSGLICGLLLAIRPGLAEVGIEVAYDGRQLAISIREPVTLRQAIEAVGAAAHAETIVRRDGGPVGPLDLGPGPAGEVLRDLVGRNTLALTYWQVDDPKFDGDRMIAGALRRIILMARDPSAPPLPPPEPVAPSRAEAEMADGEEGFSRAHTAVPSDLTRQLLRRIAELGAGGGDPQAVVELEDTYYGAPSVEVRRAVIVSLARLRTPESLALIERLGLTDAEAEMRMFAARALYRTAGDKSRAALTDAAAAEVDPTVRREILDMLGGG